MPMLPERAAPLVGRRERVRESANVSRMRRSKAWLDMRAYHLTTHPFCEACKAIGRYVMATDVDHIRPHKGDSRLFFDPSNLQSLCKACHSKKTASEDGGFGNRGRK